MKEHLSRLARGTWVYGIGKTLGLVLSFLLLPVFTSYLAPRDYGIISILGFIAFLVNPVFGLGLGVSTGIVYFDGNSAKRKCETIWGAFLILCISCSILLGLAFSCSKTISYLAFQTDAYARYVKLYLVVAVFGILILPFQQRLQFEEKARIFIIVTFVSSLVTICCNVVFVVFLLWGVEGWIIGNLIGSAVGFLLFGAAVIPFTKFRVNLSVGKALLKYGYPMIPSFIFLFIMGSSGKYMLQWFRGLDEVGIYAIGYNMGNIMQLAVGAFKTAWYPFFQSFVDEKEKAKELFGKVFTYYVFGFGALTLLFFILAKPVTVIMTKPAFHDAYKVVGLMAVSQFFIGIFSIFLSGVYYAKKVYISNIVQGLGSIIVIVANLVLIPMIGFVGAGLAMTIGYVAMGILQHSVNIVKKFWVPRYEWMRVFRFTVVFIAVVIFSTFFSLKLSRVMYMASSGIVIAALMYYIWLFLSREEKLFAKKRVSQFTNRWKSILLDYEN